jgi:surfactin synthase thioesterase subunit
MTVRPAQPGPWVRRFHPKPDCAVRLVCLPHAGGSASFFHPFSKVMPPSVEVLAIQYPGRQDRHGEPNIGDLPQLADRVAAELRPYADRPMALFGHSMGALVAFEAALRIERAGLPSPARLFVSGRRAPSVYRNEAARLLDDDGLIAELRLLSGAEAPFLTVPEVMEMSLPAIRSDYLAVEAYRHTPGAAVECPVTVLTGSQDPRVDVEEARAWSEHTAGPTELCVFPGGHFFLVARAAEVTALVSARLAEAAAPAPVSPERVG